MYLDSNKTKKDIENKITNLQIKISNTCNLNCKYCYANQGNYGKKDTLMSKETAKKLAEKINNIFPNIEKISFFGGEPLLNIEAVEIIVSELKNKKITYSLVSNTTIVNDNIINLLNNNNIKIISSLDGPQKFNDINRISNSNQGSYNIISQNLSKLLSQTKSLVMIEAVYSLPLYKEISKYELYKFFHEKFPTPFIGIGDVLTEDKELKLPEEYNLTRYNQIDIDIDFTTNKILNNEFIPVNSIYEIISQFLGKKPQHHFVALD